MYTAGFGRISVLFIVAVLLPFSIWTIQTGSSKCLIYTFVVAEKNMALDFIQGKFDKIVIFFSLYYIVCFKKKYDQELPEKNTE